jgi:diacylglycerol kinase family enzyme
VARYRLTLDGRQQEVNGVTCQVDNVGGGDIPGLTDRPNVSFTDRLLEVTVINHLLIDSLLSAASPPKASHHWQVREAIIEADPVQHVSVDGDVWSETPTTMRVLPQAVRFVVGRTPKEDSQ